MAWLPICLLAASLLISPASAAVCPNSCVCSTTRDGLHRVTCSSIADIYKYTIRQKHHNINILDLSHNNITKITHELDKLTEVVTLDLSTNGLTELNKFLLNAKKLVHLNLAHNRIQKLSLTHLPTSISSLDLTGNLLKDVPSEISHLPNLEHLELDGNPLDCSCDNIIARDRLLQANVYIDSAKCHTPNYLKEHSWLEIKTKDICKGYKADFMDIMMGDQPMDAVQVGEETTALRSMPLVASSDLDDGKVIHGADAEVDDDSSQFIKVGHFAKPSPIQEIEGSGEAESTTISDIMEPIQERKMYNNLLANDEILPADNYQTTEDPGEGSGEGSGFGLFVPFENEPTEKVLETTTPIIEDLNPDPVERIFKDDENSTDLEFPMPEPPTIYQGGPDWHSKKNAEVVTSISAAPEVTRDTTVSEPIRVTHLSEVLGQAPPAEEKTPHKTGTYVCIALIVILLVGLIGFAIAKGQMRKRRDRRLLRQQKRDIERASKEMVDMNKSLLGKPAAMESATEKKVNGKYELVPTHETHSKKAENGEMGNGIKRSENENQRTDSPRDTNQNKSSSIDNNLANENHVPAQETSFESDLGNNSRKDTNSLSSEDIFVPINDDDGPRINGNRDSDLSQPLINGDPNIDSDYLSPSREYVPVYSPDMGRVRIKMSETPKPKTPVLVTRSRSNAGDIIITPSLDGNAPKSTT